MVRVTSTQRHWSEQGGWELVSAAPGRPLQGLVSRYCGYVEDAPQPRRRVEVPSRDVTLILSLGPPIEVG